MWVDEGVHCIWMYSLGLENDVFLAASYYEKRVPVYVMFKFHVHVAEFNGGFSTSYHNKDSWVTHLPFTDGDKSL